MQSIWNAYGIHMGVFVVLAGPAAAQSDPAPFSPEPTESCLAAAADPIGQEACVGTAAMACIDGPNGSSNAGMGFCLGAEHAFWDARLNAAYAALLALEEADTSELKELGSAAPSTAEALRAMERAWIAVSRRGLRVRGEHLGRRQRRRPRGRPVHDGADRAAGAGARDPASRGGRTVNGVLEDLVAAPGLIHGELVGLAHALEWVSDGLDILAIVIMLIGTARFVVGFAAAELARDRVERVRGLDFIRMQLGRYILAALELLIVSDIIHTALSLAFKDLLFLGLLVLIRSLISFFLDREIRDIRAELGDGGR